MKNFPFRAVFALFLPLLAHAGVRETVVEAAPAPFSPFEAGTREFAFTAGFLLSPLSGRGTERPTLNYAQQDLAFGWMLTTPGQPGLLRGNWEFLLNAFAAEVVEGPGSYMAGGRLLLRYNFVQPEARVVPFVQIGAGGLGNDIHKNQTQRLIGSAFEFTLVANVGLRVFVSPRWALVFAADYEHVSNANTAPRNCGMNAIGGSIGITTFF